MLLLCNTIYINYNHFARHNVEIHTHTNTHKEREKERAFLFRTLTERERICKSSEEDKNKT